MKNKFSFLLVLFIITLSTCYSNSETAFIGWVNSNAEPYDGSNANVSMKKGYFSSPSLAIDSSGNPYIAWEDWSSKISEIYLVKWNGKYWINMEGQPYDGENANISNNSGYSSFPSLVLDFLGNPCIAWQDTSFNIDGIMEICFIKWNGFYWTNAQGQAYNKNNIKVSKNKFGRLPSLALDSSDLPNISWVGFSNEVFYIKYDGNNWINATGQLYDGLNANISLGNGDITSSSLALDANDCPCITWDEEVSNSNSNNSEIIFVKWDGYKWLNSEGYKYNGKNANISKNDGISTEPSLVIDTLNRPCIVWQDGSTNNYEIFFVKWDGNNWTNAEKQLYDGKNANISKNVEDSDFPSIALDSLGNPCITWVDMITRTSEIFYIRWDGNNWINDKGYPYDGKNANISISKNDRYSVNSSIAIDPSGNPCIAWEEGLYPDRSEIFFIRWNK